MTNAERRLTAVFGIVSSVLTLAAWGMQAGAPKLGTESADEFARWLTDHRGNLLFGLILGALAWTASLGFVAGVRRVLVSAREGAPSTLADMGFIGAVVIFAIVGACQLALGAVAFLAGTPAGVSPDLARFAHAFLLTGFAVSAAPTLLLVGAWTAAIIRSRALPSWVGWSFIAVGVVHVGALVSVARTGVFAPEGVFAIGAPALYETWQAAVSIVLLRPNRAG
jgi:hypothetical protein